MRDYNGFNITRLQILEKAVEGKGSLSCRDLEKRLYHGFLSGPQYDLFVEDIQWLVQSGYLDQVKERNQIPLRFDEYCPTEKGHQYVREINSGWLGVLVNSGVFRNH